MVLQVAWCTDWWSEAAVLVGVVLDAPLMAVGVAGMCGQKDQMVVTGNYGSVDYSPGCLSGRASSSDWLVRFCGNFDCLTGLVGRPD